MKTGNLFGIDLWDQVILKRQKLNILNYKL